MLDIPEAYGEVSASAGIAAAMIVQHNPLHAKDVNKALSVIIGKIADNGRVQLGIVPVQAGRLADEYR